MSIKLTPVAEKQVIEIQYALGCTKSQAISIALESMNAFEQITDDQIYNWLDDNHKEKLLEWNKKNEGKLSNVPAN